MCAELRQGFAAACDTNVPYRGEVGTPLSIKATNPAVVGNRQEPVGTSAPVSKEPGEQAEERGEAASTAFAEATAGQG